jgi:hypothetical protein
MPSICKTFRRLSSTLNLFKRISVSRDFINPYSPEAARRDLPAAPGTAGNGHKCGAITLVFGFQDQRHSRPAGLTPPAPQEMACRSWLAGAGAPLPSRQDLLTVAGTFNQVFTRVVNHCVTSLRIEANAHGRQLMGR